MLGPVAQWLGRWTLKCVFGVGFPGRALCCVLRKDTLLRFPLSTHVYKWVPDPVQDWGRQRQRGRGDGRRPHYAGPVKSEMLHISLTYDHLVMVIPLPCLTKKAI